MAEISEMFRLDGKTAIITGGSKGLGRAIAEALAAAGASVFIVSRKETEAKAVAAEIGSQFGKRASGFAADIARPEQVDALTQAALAVFGQIDILVNSAGINIRGPIDGLSLDQFRQVMDINVTGSWLCAQAVVPHMKERRAGRIINIASTLGVVALANRTPYASSKGAVVQMTRALALELAPFDITVNALCPGPFLTDMNVPIAGTEEGQKFIVEATAFRRWGRLAEIQGPALLLASDASSYMTGSLLFVDGGWTAR